MAANISDPVVQAIVAARVALLFNDPWYGNLATRCEIVEDKDHPDMSLTYDKIIYRRNYVESLNPEALIDQIRYGIDECVRRLDNNPINKDQDEQKRYFIAAVINAHNEVGSDQTPAIAQRYIESVSD